MSFLGPRKFQGTEEYAHAGGALGQPPVGWWGAGGLRREGVWPGPAHFEYERARICSDHSPRGRTNERPIGGQLDNGLSPDGRSEIPDRRSSKSVRSALGRVGADTTTIVEGQLRRRAESRSL